MRKYLITFWWKNDNRGERVVEAMNEISALCKALEDMHILGGWVKGALFRITIELNYNETD